MVTPTAPSRDGRYPTLLECVGPYVQGRKPALDLGGQCMRAQRTYTNHDLAKALMPDWGAVGGLATWGSQRMANLVSCFIAVASCVRVCAQNVIVKA